MALLRNQYHCVMETNQNGKLCVRVLARFGRNNWSLRCYFLASTFDRAMKKLEQVVQFLQKNEERLWFWGIERSDDPAFANELLSGAGVRVDRRKDFPKRAASVVLAPDKPAPAFLLAPMRRRLTEIAAVTRVSAASD
jgi:hypothetical protein